MRVFIASHSQSQAASLKSALECAGHEVSARWITTDTKFGHGLLAYTDLERRDLAQMDERDVRSSDALVVLAETEGKTVPGGKHVETGIALALGKPVAVLGRRENIFHWHPSVTVVTDVPTLLKWLESLRSDLDLPNGRQPRVNPAYRK